MKRQTPFVDVRTDTGEHPEQVAARVGPALECTFAAGEFQKGYAQVANVFGLKLSLVAVTGAGGKDVVKLVGGVAERGFVYGPDGAVAEHDRVDISDYVVDLLNLRTDLRWYRPTAEDRAAEAEAARGYDDWLGGGWTRGWSSEDEERNHR